MSINRTIISGNLTRDPESREFASGTKCLCFSVAVNERVKDASGEWTDRPNYIDCTMFGARVPFFADKLTKGTKVTVEGKLRWSQWDAKDGSGKRSKIEVIVDELEFVSAKAKDSDYQTVDSVYDEDVPF